MKFEPLAVAGAYLVASTPVHDERGSFGRVFCAEEFGDRGLDARVAQLSVSTNVVRGTLRGMHYTPASSGEAKLVRCPRGRIYDVLLDLRPESGTYGGWCAEELGPDGRAIYVPAGVAHGFLTLIDETDVLYQMSTPYDATQARGVRYDDPAFGIRWPFSPRVLSTRDAEYPDHPWEGPTNLADRGLDASAHLL